MEINKISNSPNFNGYKNILSGTIKELSGKNDLAFMTMQLDNIGHNDLEIWHNIQKNVLGKEKFTDIITFSCVFFSNLKNHFWVGGQDISVDGKSAVENYSSVDMEKFKTFSFIANLTKRLMNENRPLVYDNDRDLVVNKARADLCSTFKLRKYEYDREAEILANNLVLKSYMQQEPPQAVAGVVNNKISDIMSRHFSD